MLLHTCFDRLGLAEIKSSWTKGQPTERRTRMSALGQKRTFAAQTRMSALPPKADMCAATRDVRFVPIATLDKNPAARRPPHMRFRSMQLRDVFELAL